MSNFQNRISTLLKKVIGNTSILQEVPVKKLFPKYPSGMERYDLVAKSWKLIVECHGNQHHKLTTFGGDIDKAHSNFIRQKVRDSQKREVALENGWKYIVIWYDEATTDDQVISILKARLLQSIAEEHEKV